MTVAEARNSMTEFVKKREGTTVLFRKLSEAEKYVYVMVKSFGYYNFLKGAERVRRAIENADAHKRSDYEVFMRFPTECMLIGKED